MDSWRSKPKLLAENLTNLAIFPNVWPEVELVSVNIYFQGWLFPLLQLPGDGRSYACVNDALVAPLPYGNITLHSTSPFDDPLNLPPTCPLRLTSWKVIIAIFHRMREIASSAAKKDTVLREVYLEFDHEIDEDTLAILCTALVTGWDALCICKRKRNENTMTVLDSTARMHFVKGLRVFNTSTYLYLWLATIEALSTR